MPSISGCIATHERADLLRGTIAALGRQRRRPDEIVVSDSSLLGASETVVQTFADDTPAIAVKRVPNPRGDASAPTPYAGKGEREYSLERWFPELDAILTRAASQPAR